MEEIPIEKPITEPRFRRCINVHPDNTVNYCEPQQVVNCQEEDVLTCSLSK